MLGTQHLALFVVSGLLLNITPGQDTLYILGRTLSQGRSAGLMSVLGISSGSVVHTLAAALGLSAILAASANAFLVIKFAGAAYLVYLGLGMLLSRAASGSKQQMMKRESNGAIFRAAFLTNVLNPKVALFFLAFLPQFVAPDAHSRMLTLVFLGGVFIFNGTLWCLALVYGASAFSRRLRMNQRTTHFAKRATGALFVGLGAKLALTK